MMSYRITEQILPLLSVLRKRHLGFLLLFKQTSCESAERDMSSKVGTVSDAATKTEVTKGLLLYYHQYSFYSQKVVMALHEKGLPFESHIVDITKGEQYAPWFLKINSRAEVPVLQDTGKIIPDSTRIIDYIEDNFSNGDTPRLIPLDEGPDVRQRVTSLRSLLETIPIGVITMGSFFHQDLVENPKVPFIAPIRRMMANSEKGRSETLREHARKNLDAKIVLSEKADFQDKKEQLIMNKDEYILILKQLEEVLMKVEDELRKHTEDKSNWWLCSESFSVADIALTILLERLNELGFENRFWAKGRRPLIEEYFERVQQRESFKKTIPSTLFLIKTILASQVALLGVTAVGLVIGGAFILKKLL